MPKYKCNLERRSKAAGPISQCNKCRTKNCKNPIEDIYFNSNITGRVGEGNQTERLWPDFDRKIRETTDDYYIVLNCKGYTPPKNITDKLKKQQKP